MTKEKFVLTQENYVSLEYIGEGKFAQIYRAKCIKDGSIVALRRLKLTENASVNDRKFKKEAATLSTIRNPNVLECFGVFLQPKTFVLEYCEQIVSFGEETARIHSLKGLLVFLEDNIRPFTKLKVMYDISYGLSYLHGLGVIADDVKPSNILLAADWMFKIADFSVETLKRHKDLVFSTTCSKYEKDLTYTLYYLAPELMENNISNFNKTEKTDIFSFSILSFEVLFPLLDFCIHLTQVQHFEAIKNNWRPLIPTAQDELDKSLINIVVNCWDQNPEKRMSAVEVNEKLKILMKKVSLNCI